LVVVHPGIERDEEHRVATIVYLAKANAR